MTDNHFSSAQALSAVCENANLTDAEIAHVSACPRCHEWLASLMEVARKGNMKTTLELPKLRHSASATA